MSHKLYLGSVAQVDGSAMTIGSGKQLNVVDAPTSDNNAANKKYVDLKSKEVQDALNLVIAGSDVNFDTLLEIKTFADNIASTGAGDVIAKVAAEKGERLAADDVLTAAVSAEAATRLADDNTERAARIAAVSAEETARIAAVSAEVVNRDAAISSAVSTEVSNRNTAISSAVSTETNNRVSGDAKLDMLAIKSSKTMLYSPAVLGEAPSLRPDPLELCNYFDNPHSTAANFDGWRMRNSETEQKFSLYIPVGSPPGVSPGIPVIPNPQASDYMTAINSLRPYLLKVGDVKAMYLELCAISVVSMPFITIYTLPKFDGNDYVDPELGYAWYRSRKTFVPLTSVLVPYSNYNMVVNLKNVDTYDSPYFTRLETDVSESSKNIEENMSDNDEIMYITIDSNSSSAAGNVECIIGKFKLQLATGINEFVFSNTHVFANYMKQRQSQLWNALYGTSSTDDPFMTPAFTIPVSYDGR